MTKNVDAAIELVEALSRCRCCLQRAPARVLHQPYERRGRTEIYLDMLKECFSIRLTSSSGECGICEECVERLRDASDFKLQVQRSQAELRERLERALQLLDDDAKSATEEGPYEISSDGESSETRDNGASDEEASFTTHTEDMHTDSRGARAEEEACACDTCGEQFTNKMDLDEHSQTHTQASVAYKNNRCHICNRKFKNETILINHLRIHTGERPYACKKCNRRFTQKQNMIRHVKNRSCNYYLRNSVHVTTQSTRESSKNIKKHSSKVVTDSAVISSKKCEITPANPDEYSSDITGKEFVSSSNLKKHSKQHFECKICHKRYSHISYLRGHLKLHTEDNRYSCPTCKKTFTNNSAMNRHIRIHTGEKPYSCEICKRRFTVKANMLRHVKIHTSFKRKQFPCKMCHAGFTRESNLKIHMRKHTGQKIHTCEICNKRFAQKSKFVMHVQKCISKLDLDINTVKENFKCDTCSKEFSLKQNLVTHMKLHKGLKPVCV